MSIPAYLLIMSGQGDTNVKLVSKEIFDWVQRPDTPGRKGKESCWVDTAAPQNIIDALAANGDEPDVTSGSYNNNRALLIPDSACEFADYGGHEVLRAAEDYANVHGYRIVTEWEGCIY